MTVPMTWLPFGLLLLILPFPGTVAARLLLLLIVFLIAAGWRWRAAAGPQPALPCKPALGLWAMVCFASLTYAIDPLYSLGEIKNELGYTMMGFFAFFMLGQHRDATLFALRALASGMGIMASWAMLTWTANDWHWFEAGRHGGAGIVATYVATALPALLWLALDDPSALWRRVSRSLIVAALFLAAICAQRAVWPALAVEAALAMVLLARSGRIAASRRHLALGLGALFAVVLGAILLLTLQRYGSAQEVVDDTRLMLWPRILATIAAHPLAGAGFGIQSMHKAYPNLIPEFNRELWHAHNVFLNYGLSLGLPGVLALVALFAAWAGFFWRTAVGEGSAVTAGIAGVTMIAGVVVRNQFNDFFVRDMSLLFWSLTGLYAGRGQATDD